LGPIIPVTPSSTRSSTGLANDLKPDIFNLFTVNNFFNLIMNQSLILKLQM
jgi:hypothetical protein